MIKPIAIGTLVLEMSGYISLSRKDIMNEKWRRDLIDTYNALDRSSLNFVYRSWLKDADYFREYL